jgi:O-methyltransferase involved in polyketide biosynthesis
MEPLDLSEIPETMLWNLFHRASEAARPDAVLADPVGEELLGRLGDDLTARFGEANPLLAQAQALRAARFDGEVRRFLSANPNGTVAALGEGLETQFWRTDNGAVDWVSVDLGEAIDARRRLLPASDRLRAVACSVLDRGWIDEVGETDGALLSAQGLLMYLHAEQVHDLLRRLAERFPGADLVFDAVPGWFSERTMRGMRSRSGYRPPPRPWGLGDGELQRLAEMPGVDRLAELSLPRGRGLLYGRILPLLGRRRRRPIGYLAPWSILRAEFSRP